MLPLSKCRRSLKRMAVWLMIVAICSNGCSSAQRGKYSWRPDRLPIQLPSSKLSGTQNRSTAIGELLLMQQLGRQAASKQTIVGAPSADLSTYKCAKYCTCSLVQVLNSGIKSAGRANLTKAYCESNQFSDVLTIDRRTQIIHIVLQEFEPATMFGDTATRLGDELPASNSFRMPRLVQFNQLREIVIVNLKIEVCDSEVFKRGQKLRRIQWNHNKLRQVTKSCFRYLDHLVDLNLDSNLLEELESALFSQLISLKSLSIANNRLSELAAHQFANLTRLVSLNLAGNLFKSINLYLFEPMQANLRLLVLADNQIKMFLYQQQAPKHPLNQTVQAQSKTSGNLFSGAIFSQLAKLNVDRNKLERIKNLQLHRFFNIKFLSIRANSLLSIRDRAFNGLKLIELNLAQNKLQTISRCAFCNSTIKRLVLSQNNISMPLSAQADLAPATVPAAGAVAPAAESVPASGQLLPSPNGMLILSQSIFGPLFGQLEYLDLSENFLVGNSLEPLLEPLLELKYLNLASVGFDGSLPTPHLFKNLRQLRYLNMSHNQLDMLVQETIEPLVDLEVLDLSTNKFSELDESFLVALDDLTQLRLINLAGNPWYCSQCKIAALYDWLFRSTIYNSTCVAPLGLSASLGLSAQDEPSSPSVGEGSSSLADSTAVDSDETSSNGPPLQVDEELAPQSPPSFLQQTSTDYSLLVADSSIGSAPNVRSGSGSDGSTGLGALSHPTDFDLILMSNSQSGKSSDDALNYKVSSNGGAIEALLNPEARLVKLLAISQDDLSIAQTIASLQNAAQLQQDQPLEVYLNALRQFPTDFCVKCGFPSELRPFNVHELSPADFKYCPSSTNRYSASEPKIGLTLAIVIIAALLCVIIGVIVMYRKKSQAYYPNEEPPANEQSGGGLGKQQPILSISSNGNEQQYGDATDYSSPPMSQSFESFSNSEELAEEDYDSDEDEEAGDEDEEEDDDEDEDLDAEEEEDADGDNEVQVGESANLNRHAKSGETNRSPESGLSHAHVDSGKAARPPDKPSTVENSSGSAEPSKQATSSTTQSRSSTSFGPTRTSSDGPKSSSPSQLVEGGGEGVQSVPVAARRQATTSARPTPQSSLERTRRPGAPTSGGASKIVGFEPANRLETGDVNRQPKQQRVGGSNNLNSSRDDSLSSGRQKNDIVSGDDGDQDHHQRRHVYSGGGGNNNNFRQHRQSSEQTSNSSQRQHSRVGQRGGLANRRDRLAQASQTIGAVDPIGDVEIDVSPSLGPIGRLDSKSSRSSLRRQVVGGASGQESTRPAERSGGRVAPATDSASGSLEGRQAALRGIPTVATERQVGREEEEQQQQRPAEHDFRIQSPSGSEVSPPTTTTADSLVLDLRELPSDLDEDDVERLLAGSGDGDGNSIGGGGRNGGGRVSPSLRQSASTHSALTQTGADLNE